jgi:hypothetical protein
MHNSLSLVAVPAPRLHCSRSFSSKDPDADLDAILAKDPAFLQWFVKVWVPSYVDSGVAGEQEVGLDGEISDAEADRVLSSGYRAWIELGKPLPEDTPPDAKVD